jgi:hypothetical protein
MTLSLCAVNSWQRYSAEDTCHMRRRIHAI